MRKPVVCTIVGLGLLSCSCNRPIAYLNADELVITPNKVSEVAPCNDLEQQGAEVELRGSQAPAPTPAGGSIEDGTYILSSSILHTKDQSDGALLVGMGKTTMLISGSTSQVVRNTVNGHERRTTVTRVSTGTSTTLRTTCASPSPSGSETATATYTATGSVIQFITPGPAGTVVATYKKVPSANAVSSNAAER